MRSVRPVSKTYRDPLDEIWLGVARRTGFKVTRTADVYAGTDGDGTLHVAAAEHLDADDCLAQMILHELCHALVEGETAWTKPDWGLDNQTGRDEPRERACLRLQAALSAMHGLGALLAPTTEHRAFWDALGEPLAPADDPAVVLARAGLERTRRKPFWPHLHEALALTGRIARQAAPFCAEDSLVATVGTAPPRHPTSALLHPAPGLTCGTCAWMHEKEGELHCHKHIRALQADWPACEGYEPADEVDCLTCGACCREAFGSVGVRPHDVIRSRYPHLVVIKDSGREELLRVGDRCASLTGGNGAPYMCRIYEDRPQTCSDFPRRGDNCLMARRRVGMSW